MAVKLDFLGCRKDTGLFCQTLSKASFSSALMIVNTSLYRPQITPVKLIFDFTRNDSNMSFNEVIPTWIHFKSVIGDGE